MAITPSPFATGFLQCCPKCGKGKLFKGVLSVVDDCAACGLDLKSQDSGDGPAFFAIVIVGFIVAGLSAYVEITYAPPTWVHIVLWPPLTLILSLYVLRVSKATLIAFQYKHHVKGLGE